MVPLAAKAANKRGPDTAYALALSDSVVDLAALLPQKVGSPKKNVRRLDPQTLKG
jgi:hypothetical protein